MCSKLGEAIASAQNNQHIGSILISAAGQVFSAGMDLDEAVEAAAAPAQGTGAQAASRRRDPFINPITAVREGLSTACQGGKRCLEVTEIILRGIVRAPTGMIAVVENAAQRTYFLRENDPIYNGFVQKITPDTVVFKEHFIDSLGRDNQREIVKTVNAPVV